MPKDDRVYLGHMLDMSRKAMMMVRDKDRQDFDRDETLRLALAYLLQIVGEAARHVSQSFRDAHPDVPWTAIIGMRHKVVHDYMSVDEDVVWSTVTQELTALVAQLERIVPQER